jgi:transposase
MTAAADRKVDAQRIAVYAYKNRDEVHLWVPKRDIIQKLDRLTATRSRLVKVCKMLQSPLTDSKGFLTKKDHSEARKSCQKSIDSLKKDIQQVEKQPRRRTAQ